MNLGTDEKSTKQWKYFLIFTTIKVQILTADLTKVGKDKTR